MTNLCYSLTHNVLYKFCMRCWEFQEHDLDCHNQRNVLKKPQRVDNECATSAHIKFSSKPHNPDRIRSCHFLFISFPSTDLHSFGSRRFIHNIIVHLCVFGVLSLLRAVYLILCALVLYDVNFNAYAESVFVQDDSLLSVLLQMKGSLSRMSKGTHTRQLKEGVSVLVGVWMKFKLLNK